MKLAPILLLCAALTGSQFTNAEGLLLFQNKLALPEQSWPVFYDGDSIRPGGPAAGAGFAAQLLAGPSPDQLAPVGPPVIFATGPDAGFFDQESDPSGLVRLVPTVDEVPGGQTYVKVVAWPFGPSARTYDEVQRRINCRSWMANGESPLIVMDTALPDGSESPTMMVTMLSFSIITPLSGQSDVFYVRGRTHELVSLDYYANFGGFGGVHVLEHSTNLIDWHEAGAFTNAVTLGLELTNNLPALFIRMRKSCD